MDKPDDPPFDLYKPRLQPHHSDGVPVPNASVLGNSLPASDLMDVDHSRIIRDVDDSQLVGVSVPMAGAGTAVDSSAAVDKVNGKFSDKVVVERSLGFRRRGRPPRGQVKAPPPPPRQKKDEEDVCFICFDGGSLVLCDRR